MYCSRTRKFCASSRVGNADDREIENSLIYEDDEVTKSSDCLCKLAGECSTDCERPYCYCHLANKFGSCRIFPVIHSGPRDAPRIVFFSM